MTTQLLEMVPFEVSPERLRKLIEGLRALPNVTDMAVINTISELDRIACLLEEIDKKRTALAEQLADRMIESLRLMEADPNCKCPRCESIRAAKSPDGTSDSTNQKPPASQLN